MSEPVPATAPPVFVVGCGRSGTTLLRLMLDAHSELAIPGETHFLITLWQDRRRFESPNGRLDAEALVRSAMSSHQFRYWDVPEGTVLRRVDALPSDAGFADAIGALYMAYADEHRKRRWGDKTPQYVRSIPTLARVFDGSRFVHVIRDGRDVALSYLSLRWGPPNVWRAARVWRDDVTAGRRAGEALGPARYLEVRYERLVAEPAATLREVCAFLGLTFEPGMLDYHVAGSERLGGRPDRAGNHGSSIRPPTQGLRDWRTEMPADQVRAFESVAGPMLTELGYARRFSRISPVRRAYSATRSRIVRPHVPGRRKIRSTPKARPGDDPVRAARPVRVGGPAAPLLRSANSRSRRRVVGGVVRSIQPVLPRAAPPREPIFILGSPRSGTTMLFGLLSRSPAVGALPGEGHLLWNLYHAEGVGADAGRDAQATPPEAITTAERRALNWMIGQIAGDRTYLDKTPRNSLQVPYLHALFPDARFVFLARDGRAVVSSLINGWRDTSGMFPGRPAPIPVRIEGYGGDRWKFIAPPGWDAYASGHTLAEVCAFQWRASTDAIIDARAVIPASQWVEVRYERFTESPVEEAKRLLDELRLPIAGAVVDAAADLDRTVSKATSPPRRDKWRDENPDEVESILPYIRPTMERLGYPLG